MHGDRWERVYGSGLGVACHDGSVENGSPEQAVRALHQELYGEGRYE